MAMAVAHLVERKVKRIVLTRPGWRRAERLASCRRHRREGEPVPAPAPRRALRHGRLEKASAFIERGTVEVAPLAFMRGRTLNDAFIILDEAQNTTTSR